MQWLILLICCTLQVLCSMVLLSWGPLAPFLVNSFHATHTQLGLFMTIVYLASLLFSLFAGWLTDRIGVRLLMSICPGAMGLCYVVFSQSITLLQAYIAVFLIGLSYVLLNPTTTKALRMWFPANMRGTAMSIKQAGVTMGGAAGAIILPSLSSAIGWRTGVTIVGSVLAIGTIIGYFFYRDPPSTIPAVGTEVLHFSDLWNVIKNRDLLLLSLMCGVFAAVQLAVSTHLVIYLVEVRSLSPVRAGAYLLLVNIAGTIGRIAWGVISDRVLKGQRRPVLMIIGVIIALIAVTIAVSGSTMSDWLLGIVVFFLGFTAHGWNGIYFAAASEMADDRLVASGIGWSLTVCYFGTLAGPPLFGNLIDVTASYSITWIIFGIVTGVSVFLLLPVRERRSSNGSI